MYLQFLTIFLKDVNAVNILFQKREALVTKIQEETMDLFNTTINLILLDDCRILNLREKLKLLEYIKESKTVKINAKFLKDPSLFRKHMLSIYKNKISWNSINEIAKLDEIAKNMIEYIKRLSYKMKLLFPFDDELLQALSCLNPGSFSFNSWKMLADRYTNIIKPDKFNIFYKELQKFEIDLDSNKGIFENLVTDKNLMKFYNNKNIKEKYNMMATLANSLICLPFSNSEIERMFLQFKLTKTQLRVSLNDETIEGLMLWKMNYDLLKISNENTLQKLYVKYTEVFKKENIEEKKEEDKSMKRKFDKITEIDEQIQEINPIKELKLSSDTVEPR